MNFLYIDNNQALADFCKSIEDCKLCALDTEFLREKTYYSQLALIQVATEHEEACIDPLAVDDFSPLIEVFNNTFIVKILHSPSQDLEIFYQNFNALPEPLFDTQLAAAVLGFASQIGYADLVKRTCGVQLEKKYTRTDWTKRPLSDGELNYAMDDVRYLIKIYRDLTSDLTDRNRLSWIQADLQKMSDKSSYQLDMSRLWMRLKGVQRLKGVALNNADQLCRWREQKAIDRNRPRRWIMKDEDIVDIARLKPASHHELEQIGSLSKDYVRKNGDAILQVLSNASSIDSSDYPQQPEFIKLSNQQQAIADCLMAICRDVAEKNDIALTSITSKKDIDALVAGNSDSKLSSGWRYEMLGRHLTQFLKGEVTLSYVDGRLEYC